MTTRYTGRTILVTGAGLGLGRAIALAFAALGASMWACDILAEGLDETRAMATGALHTRVTDVTDKAQVQAFVAEAVAATGRIDALVNDAGGLCGQSFVPLEELDQEAWHQVVNANLTSAFLCAQAATPAMKQAGYDRIVNIASGAGLTTTVTGIQAYASAKGRHDRPDPPACPGAGPVRHHRERRRTRCHSLQCESADATACRAPTLLRKLFRIPVETRMDLVTRTALPAP